MTRTLRTAAMSTVLVGTLALASCGSSGSSAGSNDQSGMNGTTSAPAGAGTPATGAKNEADVTFATDMIPHHTQAVEMAGMAAKQASDPRVKALATKISQAQAPEIAQMSGWLKGWGAPDPGTGGGHDMSGSGGMDAEGMMSSEQMTDLGKANGPGFDRMWLEAMTRHHNGAVAVAKTEITKGANPDAKKLAQAIIDSQSTEITEMKSILASLPG